MYINVILQHYLAHIINFILHFDFIVSKLKNKNHHKVVLRTRMKYE